MKDKKDSLVIVSIYRSPNSTSENNLQLHSLIKDISDSNSSHILIVGDFNYNEILWDRQITTVSENHIATKFLEIIRDNFLYQHVTEPTRIREGQEPSILDLVFTNEQNMVDKIDYSHSLGKSDHIMLNFNFILYSGLKKQNPT